MQSKARNFVSKFQKPNSNLFSYLQFKNLVCDIAHKRNLRTLSKISNLGFANSSKANSIGASTSPSSTQSEQNQAQQLRGASATTEIDTSLLKRLVVDSNCSNKHNYNENRLSETQVKVEAEPLKSINREITTNFNESLAKMVTKEEKKHTFI